MRAGIFLVIRAAEPILPFMAKRKVAQVPARYWRGGKVELGEEYYHYPSIRAQRYWPFLISLGKSRAPRGHLHGHEHEDRFVFHYIHEGEFWHEVRGKRHVARAGSVCLMDLREPVRYGNDQPAPAHVWWICFGGRDMPQMFNEVGADENPLFDKLDRARVESLFRELLALIRRRAAGFEARAAGLLMLLLAELFASREKDTAAGDELVPLPVRDRPLSQPVRDAIRYITRFYESELDLKKLSGVGGISLFHFSRLFHRETGMSCIQFLNRYRIEKAKQQLVTSDLPIHQIGRMVGIPNQFRFSRLFHKLTDATPSQFRARAK